MSALPASERGSSTTGATERGVFAQFIVGKATLGIYAFNPDSGARYLIAAFGLRF